MHSKKKSSRPEHSSLEQIREKGMLKSLWFMTYYRIWKHYLWSICVPAGISLEPLVGQPNPTDILSLRPTGTGNESRCSTTPLKKDLVTQHLGAWARERKFQGGGKLVGRRWTITSFPHNSHLQFLTAASIHNSPSLKNHTEYLRVIWTLTMKLPQHISPNADTNGMWIKIKTNLDCHIIDQYYIPHIMLNDMGNIN